MATMGPDSDREIPDISDPSYSRELEQMQNCADGFRKPFEDPERNLEKLIEKVNIAASDSRKRVTRLVSVVQGTGGGKSRLLDEFSTRYITATCQLAAGDSFPPTDGDAAEFFRGKYNSKTLKGFRREDQASRHAVCIAFIYALMTELCATLRNMNGQNKASDLHNGIFSTPVTIQNMDNDNRPIERQQFYKRVVEAAKIFYEEHCLQEDWVRIFDGPLHKIAELLAKSMPVWNDLHSVAAELTLIASPARVHIHLDGIAQLTETSENGISESSPGKRTMLRENGHQYRALQRIIAELSNFNLVWIISTTNTHLAIIAPGRTKEDDLLNRCDRTGRGMLPLIRAESMIPTIRRIQPSELQTHTYSKSSICDLNVLKTIGRRLWNSYEDPFLYCFDRMMDIFGCVSRKPTAALSLLGHRISLWKNDIESGWVDEMHNAIKDYMHLLDGREVDTSGSVVLTSHPEPILTMAACAMLSDGRNWQFIFRAYVGRARNSIFPDKGEQGEQIASIIICCALDLAYLDTYSLNFPWKDTITLGCFLKALLDRTYWDCLDHIPNKFLEMWTTAKAIKSIPQDDDFSNEQSGVWQLLHHTGVRFRPGHLSWDCSIPFCSGDRQNLDDIYHLRFQFKNKIHGPTHPGAILELQSKDWQLLYPSRSSEPLIDPLNHELPLNLVFLIDLDSKAFGHEPVRLQLDKKTHTYLLHITGYDPNTYRCLKRFHIEGEAIASLLHASDRTTLDRQG